MWFCENRLVIYLFCQYNYLPFDPFGKCVIAIADNTYEQTGISYKL